ncbi:hypothetical protein CYMTET_8365 [Cymbomonas tetramitiformis]|uniref:Cyclic nucleotide-binding domain-containing protein n=1 Tax=Cymbomonas tetramitiformis TaxID=36881 RepID=A0AAE0LGJ3_9CHLO|nr:hypothetical protein CYMTET_8365 [Cymbomonas tetramitiformis]
MSGTTQSSEAQVSAEEQPPSANSAGGEAGVPSANSAGGEAGVPSANSAGGEAGVPSANSAGGEAGLPSAASASMPPERSGAEATEKEQLTSGSAGPREAPYIVPPDDDLGTKSKESSPKEGSPPGISGNKRKEGAAPRRLSLVQAVNKVRVGSTLARASSSNDEGSRSGVLKKRASRTNITLSDRAHDWWEDLTHLIETYRKRILPTSEVENMIRQNSQLLTGSNALGTLTDEKHAEKPWWIMDPLHSTFRRYWDLLLGILILYNSIMVPFRIAFEVEATGNIEVFDFCTDLLFFIDIVLNFFTAFNLDGIQVVDLQPIAKNYVRGWFWVDFASAFPFETVCSTLFSVEDENGVMRVNTLLRLLKTMRLLRLLRLARLSRIVARIRSRFHIKFSFITIFKFLLTSLFVGHWIACGWYLVAQIEGIDEGTWVSEMIDVGEYDEHGVQKIGIHEDSPVKQYIISVYHSIMVMSTIGSYILPVTNVERIFSIVSMMIGASVFAYGMTNMCTLIFNLNRNEVVYRSRMDEINDFMKFRGLPEELQHRILEYYEHLHSRNRFFNENEILVDLSSNLQSEVIHCIHRRIINENVFFKGMDREFVSAVIMRLKMVTYMPDDLIIKQGSVGREMHFVVDGIVEIYITLPTGANKVIGNLKTGDYVGEMALVVPDNVLPPRPAPPPPPARPAPRPAPPTPVLA